MNKIILVCGVIKSGKDYYVDEYRLTHPDEVVIELKFSNYLREIVELVLGIDLKDKEVYEKWKSVPENRQILVDLGFSMKKKSGKNIFSSAVYNEINSLLLSITHNTTFIISDFRFPFEKDLINENDNYLLWLWFDTYVHFCNYKSEQYNGSIDQHTEYMAQWLCSKGYEHNTHWTLEEFNNLIKEYDDKERIN